MKISQSNVCESCGVTMHHLADFGTNRDDTVNTEYCRYCFQRGLFTDHGITLEQKIQKNIDKAPKIGMNREEATIMAHSTLPTLKRWKGLKPVE